MADEYELADRLHVVEVHHPLEERLALVEGSGGAELVADIAGLRADIAAQRDELAAHVGMYHAPQPAPAPTPEPAPAPTPEPASAPTEARVRDKPPREHHWAMRRWRLFGSEA